MSIRKTLGELVDAISGIGIPAIKVRKILESLGFPEDKIRLAIQSLPKESKIADAEDANDIDTRLIAIQEELERQKTAIESIRADIEKLSSALSKITQDVTIKKVIMEAGSLEERIDSLEATIKGIIEAMGEYVPAILNELKFRKR